MSDTRFISVLVFAALCLAGLGYLISIGRVPVETAVTLLTGIVAYLFGGITPTDRVLGLLGIRKDVTP